MFLTLEWVALLYLPTNGSRTHVFILFRQNYKGESETQKRCRRCSAVFLFSRTMFNYHRTAPLGRQHWEHPAFLFLRLVFSRFECSQSARPHGRVRDQHTHTHTPQRVLRRANTETQPSASIQLSAAASQEQLIKKQQFHRRPLQSVHKKPLSAHRGIVQQTWEVRQPHFYGFITAVFFVFFYYYVLNWILLTWEGKKRKKKEKKKKK